VRLAIAQLYERNVDLKAMKVAAQQVLDAGHPAAATELRARYYVAFADCQLRGDPELCIAPLKPLLAEAQRRLGKDNDVSIEIESALAFSLSDAQRFAEAVPMAREALGLTGKAHGTNPLAVLDRKFKLAEILSDAGQAGEAIRLLTQVRNALLAISGTENEATARAANELAKSYGDAGRYAQALPLLQLALDFHVKTRGESFSMSRAGYNNVANTLAFMGREQDAIEVGRKALTLESQALGPDHPETLWFENNLANYYDRAHDLAKSEEIYRDVLARAQRAFRHGEWDTGHFAWHLGAVLVEEGKKDGARPFLHESVRIFTAALGKDNLRTQRAQTALDALTLPHP
jgi:tetratricopeptide (TPR) repeat protein